MALNQGNHWFSLFFIFILNCSISSLEACKNIENLRILAIGGDGTVSWILSVFDEMCLAQQPPIAILPFGTGNDLARTLKWGGSYSDERTVTILNKVINGNIVRLDR